MPAHCRPLQRLTIGLGFGVWCELFRLQRILHRLSHFTASTACTGAKQPENCPTCNASTTVQRRFTACKGLHHYSASACTGAKQPANCPACNASTTVQRRFTACKGLHHYSASACTVLVRLHRFGASLPYPALKARGGATGL